MQRVWAPVTDVAFAALVGALLCVYLLSVPPIPSVSVAQALDPSIEVSDFIGGTREAGLTVGTELTMKGAQQFYWKDFPNRDPQLTTDASYADWMRSGWIGGTLWVKGGEAPVYYKTYGDKALESGAGDYYARTKWTTCETDLGFRGYHRVYVDGAMKVDVGRVSSGDHYTYWEEPFEFSTSDEEVNFRGEVKWGNTGYPLLFVGELWVEVYPKTRTYTSTVLDAGKEASWDTATWTELLPANTDVLLCFRASNDQATWTSWTAWTSTSGAAVNLDGYRYLQFRVQLKRTANTYEAPTLYDVTFSYTPVNHDPKNVGVSTPDFEVYAARATRIDVTVDDSDGASDLKKVTMVIDPLGEGLQYAWESGIGFYEQVDPNDHGSIDSSGCIIDDESPTKRRLSFMITLDWNLGTEGEVDVKIDSIDAGGKTDSDTFTSVFLFENDLTINGTTPSKVRADVGSQVTVSGYIYYQGTATPPPSGINVYVANASGSTDSAGTYRIPVTLPSAVGQYSYEVSCDHGLTNETVSIIADRVKVTDAGVSNSTPYVGESVLVWVQTVYEYDGGYFDDTCGELYINGITVAWSQAGHRWEYYDISSEAASRRYGITTIVDNLYGIGIFDDVPLEAIEVSWVPRPENVPMVKVVSGGVENNGASVGDQIMIWVRIRSEDGATFSDGVVYLNDDCAVWNSTADWWELRVTSSSSVEVLFNVTRVVTVDGMGVSIQDSVGCLRAKWIEEGERTVTIVAGGLDNNGTTAEGEITVWFFAKYDDGVLFDGSCGRLYINDEEATWNPTSQRWERVFKREAEGTETFRVTRGLDNRHGATFIFKTEGVTAYWSKAPVITIITGGLENNNTVAGDEIVAWFVAEYDDRSLFTGSDGRIYINDREGRWNVDSRRWERAFIRISEGEETFTVTRVDDGGNDTRFTNQVQPLRAVWRASGERAGSVSFGPQLVLATAVSVLGSITVFVLKRKLGKGKLGFSGPASSLS